MTDNSLHQKHSGMIRTENLKCRLVLTVLSVTILCNALNVVAQERRVAVYPLTNDYQEFTSWREGTQYVAVRYSAIVVVADQMDRLYSIHCEMTKKWDHCHSLMHDAYEVEIKGHSMKIWGQWEGNQHKAYSDKFIIDNIAMLKTPFRDHDDIDVFKKSDEFKRLLNTKHDSR